MVIAVLVTFIYDIYSLLLIVLTKKVNIIILVARANKSFQSKPLKVESKILEELTYTRVVTVAKYRLSLELSAVMIQFSLNVFATSIKLVLLSFLCLMKIRILVCHND